MPVTLVSSARPVVSAIVPTYDHRSHLLQTALASIWGQEGLGEIFDLEVIVADNASADPTAEIIRRYPGTRHIHMGSNRGLWAALNAGLRAATGKYVAFLIDDDLWLRHKLRVQVPAVESANESTIAYSQHVAVSPEGVSISPPMPSGYIFRDCLLQDVALAEQAMLVPRGAFNVAGYFDEDLESAVGDADMYLRLAFHFPFVFVPGPVAIYVRSLEGMACTSVLDGTLESEYPQVLERQLALLKDSDDGLKEKARAQAELWMASLLQEVGELERMAGRLMNALQRYPMMAARPMALKQVKRQLTLAAMASPSPPESIRGYSERLKAAATDGSDRRRAMKRLEGAIWAEFALRSAASGAGIGPVISAANRGFLKNPREWRRISLWRKLVRSANVRGGQAFRRPWDGKLGAAVLPVDQLLGTGLQDLSWL